MFGRFVSLVLSIDIHLLMLLHQLLLLLLHLAMLQQEGMPGKGSALEIRSNQLRRGEEQ